MRRLSIFAMVVAALLLVAGTASAQSKPNFTGTWTLVPDPNAAPPGGGGGGGGRGGGGRGGGRGGAVGGAEVTITQDATTLKVDRTGQTPYTLTYKLDGTDSKNTPPGRGGAAGAEVTSKATWEGAKLIITSTQSMTMQDGTPMTMTSKQALSIAADGTMVVENTTTPMGGGDPVTTKVSYKKG